MVEEVKGKITPKELAKKDITESYCQRLGYKYKFTTTVELDINKGYTEYLKLYKKPRRKRFGRTKKNNP